jgi:hypothetical protein
MHATKEEMLEAVFSVRSMPRLYTRAQLPLQKSLETAVGRVGGLGEMATSLGVSWCNELVVRQSPASMDVKTETEESTALEAVTRRLPMKIRH